MCIRDRHLTLVVFPFLRMSRKGPEQTAQEIGEYLQANESSVSAFNVIKGFLNLTIASSAWIELLNSVHANPQYGIVPVTDQSPLVMIEDVYKRQRMIFLDLCKIGSLGFTFTLQSCGKAVCRTGSLGYGRSFGYYTICCNAV